MEKPKLKYIVYSILAGIAFIAMLYSAVSLIADGSPLLKSMREHIKSANAFHKDSLYDKAIEPYRRAVDMEPGSSLANYNSGTNLLLKNYKDIKDKVAEADVVAGVYSDASGQLLTAAGNETDKLKIASARHNNALIYHLSDSLEMAAEEYKEALRNNPADDETRYNLAVVLYLLKQQQNQQNQQQEQQQEQQQQNQQQQEQEQKQQNQQQQEQQDQEQQQQQGQSQPAGGEISKEAAERLLEAAMQDEKGVLEKVKREKNKSSKRRLQKNW